MRYPRIHKAKVTDNTTLVIKFDNQEVKKYDIRKLWHIPMFSLLKEPAFFKSFKVEQGGYEIIWNKDIDLSEYELWKYGTVVEDELDLL
ncbi:MAG: DUF2442 domain-containing protein [Leptolyngbyaceae cyanobacterium SM1_1_3]|nr:DUF2442 domain-containing protein [Leptolyngbyaceae cyanobacterium SM1_1_3]NJN01191.1 DUF2442 domain-containing protein [Leptolyngbyaceae cyanobacterium RM1_1_2]NJO09037.1 DUF2442 domain-containing protein [Leptolyngbyaceae cyanobacterium SL_1_1]